MKMIRQALIVFFKELKCIVRDSKTFFVGILIPFFLVPSILFIIGFAVGGTEQNLSKNVNIAVSSKNNSFYKFMFAQDDITVIETNNPERLLDSGEISSYIIVDENLDEKIIKNEPFTLDIKYNKSSINSSIAQAMISGYEDAYRYILEKYSFKDINQLEQISKFKINLGEQIGSEQMDFSSMLFMMLVPMMLITYSCVGSSSTAAELGAGEKERGTFEPLLSTGVERSAVVLGKLLATTFMGILSSVFTVLGLFVYLILSSKDNVLGSFSVFSFVMLLVVIVIISVFFAALNLTVGIYAKSYKEAQTYLMPFYFLAMFPSFFTYTLDSGSISFAYLCVPVLNIICIIKEILSNSFNFMHFSFVVGLHIVYVFFLCLIMFKLFKKESIIFRA